MASQDVKFGLAGHNVKGIDDGTVGSSNNGVVPYVAIGYVDGSGGFVRISSSNVIPTSAVGLPAALGQTTMANSTPVVLASNQSTVPVVQQGGATLATGQVTAASAVGASSWVGTAVVASSTTVNRVTLTNFNATGFLSIGGASSLASSTGHMLPAGQQVTLYTRSGIWAIASSGQVNVSYITEAP